MQGLLGQWPIARCLGSIRWTEHAVEFVKPGEVGQRWVVTVSSWNLEILGIILKAIFFFTANLQIKSYLRHSYTFSVYGRSSV